MDIILIMVVILVALGVFSLIVGVSNDAVNFLGPAMGSKTASFRTILIVAALGIIAGAVFSGGMMEVARKGIFYPQNFYFDEIMIIFLAVMLTNVLLLDFFNTFGLPTSTTVSLVFALLGAAVTVSFLKMNEGPQMIISEDGVRKIADMGDYINTERALLIISGILVSIIISLVLGALVQWFSRLLFSFSYERKLKYFGSVWGGMAITFLTYFIVIKGAEGTSFLSENTLYYIEKYTVEIVLSSFIFWTLLIQLLFIVLKINIFKFIVLAGTFALAMAFAGNDMVNFIGVPLSGMDSLGHLTPGDNHDPENILMTFLSNPIKTDSFMLLIGGLIMVATLWLSVKARTVIKTSVDLSRQQDGFERFGSSMFSRSIVRISRSTGNSIAAIIPQAIKQKIKKRFEPPLGSNKHLDRDAPSFDMVRASSSLLVSAIIIAFGTSLGLPVSTTYVTFIVAMGASLADGAWGRESAVYRVTGVITIIGGWFFTAFSAFTISLLLALILFFGKLPAIIILFLVFVFLMIRSWKIHRTRQKEMEETENETSPELWENENIRMKCSTTVLKILEQSSAIYSSTIDGLINEDRKKLKELLKTIHEVNQKTKRQKDNVHFTISLLKEDSVETGHFYVQVLDYLRETAHCLTYITEPAFNHVDNNHGGLSSFQVSEINQIKIRFVDFMDDLMFLIEENNFSKIDLVIRKQQELLDKIQEIRINQVKMIKNDETGTKVSLLYLNMLHETKNMLLFSVNLLKAQRDFIIYSKYKSESE
ncbi:MAG: phosphate permease [Bacteroidetes bacterium GWF2_38_335]|nr:MAG: phosphate permease [Bacteroidetes bacterium GWF2_38_335]OFY80899.1 MAG: phosphate permease [Bacteroidetes bacterium RIFOXYA12_FULL_38_20]HBS84939.1 phosphate permease [Bacteroidales bacterium]